MVATSKQPSPKRFAIVSNLNSARGVGILRRLLQRDGDQFSTTKAAQDGDALAVEKILRLVSACKSAVLEEDYVDVDFRAGYGSFYGLKHFDLSRWCRRLHFFDQRIRERDLDELPNELASSYRGFLVIRPFEKRRIGRSVLSKDLPIRLGASDWPRESFFLTCEAEYEVNLFGNRLTVSGTPWMHQDSLVCSCASSAIWVAITHMAHKYPPDYNLYAPVQITELGSRSSPAMGRSMPTRGMTRDQILGALLATGVEPLPLDKPDHGSAARFAYRYVESSLPVIAYLKPLNGGSAHAVTLVGHWYDALRERELSKPLSSLPIAKGMKFSRTSDYVPAYVAQDDVRGPYCRLEFVSIEDAAEVAKLTPKQTAQLKQDDCAAVVIDRGQETQLVGLLNSLIAIHPKGVALDGFGAEQRAVWWFSALPQEDNFPRTPVLRSFLVRSNRLKEWYGKDAGFEPDMRRYLRRTGMSKWVWVTEFATPANSRKGLIFGHHVCDQAAQPDVDPDDWLLLQAGERVWINQRHLCLDGRFMYPGTHKGFQGKR